MTEFITGYSLRAPNSNSVLEFYEALRDKKDLTGPSRRYPPGYLNLPTRAGTLPEIDRFDNEFFRFNIKQTDKMDPIIRLMLEVTQEALLDAKISIPALRGSRTGVYVGHCFSDYLNRQSGCDIDKTGYELVNGAHSMAANKISYFYDLRGPSVVFDTACSSSLVALHQAQKDLQAGIIDRAIVGGASMTIDPHKNQIFGAFSMLSPDGRCYSFDERANGYCRSEGIAVVVLESARVCQHGHAKLSGSSVNNDGFTPKGITFPSSEAQAQNAVDAFAHANMSVQSIGYVEAHGTGTTVGDAQELSGLLSVLYPGLTDNGSKGPPPRHIPLGSVKSGMGHAEGASGLMSLIKCLLMYEHKVLLPNQNYASTRHSAILQGYFDVVSELAPWVPAPSCISNYGFGGTNAFAVLQPGNLVVSEESPPLSWTPNFGSLASSHASAAWFREQALLGNDGLYSFRDGRKSARSFSKIAFAYSGQGSQWSGMGRALMKTSHVFRETIARLDAHTRAVDAAVTLLDWFGEEEGAGWMLKERSGLGITAYQIGLTNMLAAEGVVPDFVMGHSLGEVAAGYAAGLQSEQQTVQIAMVRAALAKNILPLMFVLKSTVDLGALADESANVFSVRARNADSSDPSDSSTTADSAGSTTRKDSTTTTNGPTEYFYYYVRDPSQLTLQAGDQIFDLTGSMVAVGLPAPVIQQAICALGLTQTCVACYNSPAGQTVSGAAVEVAALKRYLESSTPDLFWRDIPTDNVAYHAPHLVCHYDYLAGQFGRILGRAKDIPARFICTSADPAQAPPRVMDGHFHARNIVQSVYFQQAVEALPADTLLVEVGPHQGLLGQVKRVRTDVGLLGVVKMGSYATETQAATDLAKVVWAAGYSAHLKPAVNPATRLPLAQRFPLLWNHSRLQMTFDYTDFEKLPSSDKGGGGMEVTYDLAGEHAFLLDHQIQGQPLFPATGHLYTLWCAVGLERGVDIRDFEIVQAVPLDLAAPRVTFTVQQTGAELWVMKDGAVAARAIVTAQDGPLPPLPAPLDEAAQKSNLVLDHNSLYNHFKRYGYEYQNNFRLVKYRSIPSSMGTSGTSGASYADPAYAAEGLDGFAALRPAQHVIAWLDTMLQLFLEDLKLLRLPTMIRRVQLRAPLLQAVRGETGVFMDTSTKRLLHQHALFQELHTLPANKNRQPAQLVHVQQTFVELGAHVLGDADTYRKTEAAADWMASRLTAHLAAHPEQLAARPWLAHTLAHAQRRAGAVIADKEELLANPLGAMAYNTYSDLTAMIDKPMRCISLAPEHDVFYSRVDNQAFAMPQDVLERCVMLVSQEWLGCGLRVMEGGIGTGGLTRRLWPLVSARLEAYLGLDVSAISPGGSVEQDARFSTLKHDLNEALPEDGSKYHLFCASNAIHVTRDIARTLRHLCGRLHEGGFLLLEEFIESDFCLYLWGLDPSIWSIPNPDVKRSFGLWMSWEEWLGVVAQVPELEVVIAYRTQVRLTLLLRRRSAENRVTAIEDKTAWADVDPTLAQRFVSAGSLSFFRTLVKEYASCKMHTATLDPLDPVGMKAIQAALRALPLRHIAYSGGKVGAWLSTVHQAAPPTPPTEAACALALSIQKPGDLSTLVWLTCPLTGTGAPVEVQFAGLNFKDVMYAFGKLRLESPSFGLEVSGHDAGGRRVMGIGRSNCIATRTLLDMAWAVPESLTQAQAATVPVVYLTALYAMFEKARLEPGQSLLVHGGAGGVGHAAIHLAQRRGLEVFATCSEGKRAHLRAWFGLDDAHIGNSRDLSFVEVVLAGTRGAGVDMVLNSLSGAALSASLTLVKDFGHFCEIGKFDLQNNTRVGIKVFERNVSYHAIDLAAMFAHAHYAGVLTRLLQAALDRGDVRALPCEVFPAERVADGLRCLSAGKHVGKVLVDMSGALQASTSPRYVTSGTHVITGGLGGFGMELAHWLVARGARHIVLTSRTGALRTGWQRVRYEALLRHVGVEISTADVGQAAQCSALVQRHAASLRGVWHAAMVLDDMTFAKQSQAAWDAVHFAKSAGAQNLDAATRLCALDAFVVFSSVIALHGNIGQAAYAHANASCEAVVQRRNAAGLCGAAVQWGAIDNVGFVAQHGSDLETSISQYCLQNVDDSLDCLHRWAQHRGVVSAYAENDAVKTATVGSALVAEIKDVQSKFASVLGGRAEDYDAETAVQTFGLDSLSSTVLVNWTNQQLSSAQITVEFFEDMSISKMFDYIRAHQRGE